MYKKIHMKQLWNISLRNLALRKQSLSFVIIVTAYFLLSLSAGIYFSSLKGQITKLVVKNNIQNLNWSVEMLADDALLKYNRAIGNDVLPWDVKTKRSKMISVVDYLNRLNNDPNMALLVLSSSGQVIHTPDTLDDEIKTSLLNLSFIIPVNNPLEDKEINSGDVKTLHVTSNEQSHLLTYTSIGDTGYLLGILSDSDVMFHSANRLERILMGTLLMAFAVIFFIFILMMRMIMSPLKVLVKAAEKLGSGEWFTRVKIHNATEVGVLANSFNKMAEEISDRYSEIDRYSRKLEILNEDAQRTLDILGKRNRELGMINSLTLESGRHFGFKENLNILIQRIARDFDTVFVEGYLWDERHKVWYLSVSTREQPWEIERDERFEHILNKAAMTEKVIITSGEYYSPSPTKAIMSEQLIVLPLRTWTEVQVLILVGIRKRGDFTSKEIIFLKNLMNHEAVILHNAQLYETSLRRSDTLEKINTFGQNIISELTLDKLIPRVLRELKGLLAVDRVNLIIKDRLEIANVNYTLNEEWEISENEALNQDLWCSHVIESMQSIVDQTRITAPDWVWDLYGEDYRSFLGIPLVDKDKPGVLALYSNEQRFFTQEDIQFIKTFANYLTSAIANARLFHEISEREQTRTKQIEVARKFQSDRIPYQFEQGRLEFECSLEPAMELAGDFFDVFSLGQKSVGFLIGDVATKGIAASLMTFSLLSLFRNASKTLTSPNRVMALVNQALVSQIKEQSWFATAFYARVHTDDLTMTYSRAGHVLPILYRKSTGECISLDVDGLPLGIIENGVYQTAQIQLEEEDRLVLYTDGVTELRVDGNRLFGVKKLMELVKENGDRSVSELKDAIFNEIEKTGDSRYKRDDILVAVLGIKSDPWISRRLKYNDMPELVDDIMRRLKQYKLTRSSVYAIRLSLSESLANAFKHGNKGDPSKDIQVSFLLSDDVFSLKVMDEGDGFDYEALPDPTVEMNLLLPHGRGIFLMRSFMDEVEFNDSGNLIHVTKNLEYDFDETPDEICESRVSVPEIANT